MAEFEFITNTGEAERVQANTADEAQRLAKNIAPTSGVRRISDTTIDTDQLEVDAPDLNLPAGEDRDVDELFVSRLAQPTDTQRSEDDRILRNRIVEELGDTQREEREDIEEQEGLQEKQEQLSEIEGAILQTTEKFRREREDIQAQTGLTRGQKRAAQNAIVDRQNSRLADLEVQRFVRQNAFSDAQAAVDRKVDILTADKQARLASLQFLFEENKEILTRNEQREFEAKIREEEREFQNERDSIQRLENAKLDMMERLHEAGAGASTISKLQACNDTSCVFRVGAPFGGDDIVTLDSPTTEVMTFDEFIAEKEQELGRNIFNRESFREEFERRTQRQAPGSSVLRDIVDNASNIVGAERGKTSKRSISNALGRQDYVSAYSQIANNVEDSLTGGNKDRFASARTDMQVMAGLRDAVQRYADAGGDTGLLKGKAEEITRKLGEVKDPALTALAVQLQREFQTYRNIMTGAAFTPQESADYEAVNPTTNKSLDLNLAVIDGALAALENRVVGTVESRVPNSTSIYNLTQSQEESDAPVINDPETAPLGSTITIDGVSYFKGGPNQFIEIR